MIWAIILLFVVVWLVLLAGINLEYAIRNHRSEPGIFYHLAGPFGFLLLLVVPTVVGIILAIQSFAH